jgi:type IV pilus assembly protein PilC
VVVFFLLTFFIPQFSKIFEQFGGNLPLLTRVIVSASNLVTSIWGLVTALFVAAGGIFLYFGVQSDSGRRRMERVLLATPVLGTIIASFALVRFTRMLGTLLGAGVPLVASLKVAREAIGNQTLSDTVAKAIEEVQRGSSLSKSLSGSSRLFPASVIETIAVAEETGRLDKELVRVSSSYEGDLDRQLRILVSAAEPLLLFIMAGLIGTIVVGMLLPVFKLQELVNH